MRHRVQYGAPCPKKLEGYLGWAYYAPYGKDVPVYCLGYKGHPRDWHAQAG